MRLTVLCLMSASLCALACEPEPTVATEADEPAIWAAALAFERAEDQEATPLLLDATVDAVTTPFQADDIAAQLPDVDGATVASLFARAQGDAHETALDVDARGYTIVPAASAPEATPDAPIIGVSRAGFGPDEALVYIERLCGNVCASGRLLLVERRAGEWVVVAPLDLWAS